MAIKLGDAFVSIDGDDRPLDASFSRAKGKTQAFGSVLQGILQGVGQRLFDVVIRGAEVFISKIGQAVVASSNLTEAINKTVVVFGDSAAEMIAWSETSDQALGQSQRQALDAASGFGALFILMGQGRKEAIAMSQEMVTLAADLSSIYNIPMDSALEKIRAGLAGEIEPLRAVNIFLNDNLVINKAVALGLAETTAAVDDAAKVEARRILILEQGAIAMGDFARTSREFANGQKILAAEVENGAARLGNSFRPAVNAIQNLLIDLAPQMFDYAQNIIDQFASGLASAIRSLIPVFMTIRSLFAYWFAPGSPPRILPNLTKWGAGALQAYLDGFKPATVQKALKSLGSSIESLLRGFVKTGQIGEVDLLKRVFGSREAIAAAVREFQALGRVSSVTMAEIVRQAGPAGSSVAGLVRAYFELQRSSADVAREQAKLNDITAKYQEIIDPISGALSENQAKQQAIRDQQRTQDLRDQIASLGLMSEATAAAQQELDALRAVGRTGNYFEDVQNQQRILELEQAIADGKNATADAELARLEIEAIALRQNLDSAEAQQAAEEATAQIALDAAKAAEDAAQVELDNAQAVIDLQEERNRLIAEEIALNKELEQARLDAIQKAAAEAEKAQLDASKVEDAKFNFEFSTADTAGQLALLQQKLAATEEGTVDYYQILTQLSQLQKRYNDELANPALDEATKAAQDAADAQFDYQFSIGTTAEKLALLNGKLAGTTTGSAEYYQLLTQISSLDKQRVAEIDAITDAQFNYNLAVADTPEQIELLKQKLAETTSGSVEYYQILGQISNLEEQYQNQLDSDARASAAKAEQELNAAMSEAEQAARKAAAEAENLHQAQLQYNLALTDTPGKIALMQAELANTAPGTAEYFRILTQIHQLQTQYTAELEKTAKGLGTVGAIDIGAGLGAGVTTPFGESSTAGKNLAAAIDEMAAAFTSPEFTAIPEDVKRVVDAVGGFVESITKIGVALGIIEEETPKSLAETGGYWSTFAGAVEGDLTDVDTAIKGTSENTATQLDVLASNIRVITAAMNGDWKTFWKEWEENRRLGQQTTDANAKTSWQQLRELNTFFTGGMFDDNAKWWSDQLNQTVNGLRDSSTHWSNWFTNTSTAWGNWFSERASAVGNWFTELGTSFYDGGSNIIDDLWEGMKGKWGEVETWFSNQLSWLRNQLPFSEPKDPGSPLRGLAKSGSALVGMVQSGIESASLSINPLADSLLAPAGATAGADGTTYNFGDINITIQGNADADSVRRGVNLGLSDLMRSKGINR